MAPSSPNKIPDEELGELWFAFNHSILEQLQCRAREMGAVGETQKLIAERLGRDPASINRWLRGRSNMTIRTMHDLARAMSCRLKVELQRLESLQPNNANVKPWNLSVASPNKPQLASMAKASLPSEQLDLSRPSVRGVGELRQMGARVSGVGNHGSILDPLPVYGPRTQRVFEGTGQ